MGQGTNVLSRNPNICASCSSLADGEGSERFSLPSSSPESNLAPPDTAEPQLGPEVETQPDEKVINWHA